MAPAFLLPTGVLPLLRRSATENRQSSPDRE
jgi:hypothetical protein